MSYFSTFSQVELFPGPNLNVIIGPNGTGKSTFICAVVLGLCGKTNVLGRAKKVSEFIRSGCQEATIEIDLYTDDIGTIVTITRNFNMENSSVWSVNKEPIHDRGVQELVSSLNIRVDNLCQLLPQDKVQDFAKMNPQELLRSTQLAVSGVESVELLDELIEYKNKHRQLLSKLEMNNRSLGEKEQSTARAEAVIASMEEEKKIREELEMCNRKKLWVEYNDMKDIVADMTKDKEAALKIKNDHEKSMIPLKQTLENLNITSSSLRKTIDTENTMNEKIKSSINTLLQKHETYTRDIEDVENKLKEKITNQAHLKDNLEQALASLTKMFNDQDHIIKSNGDEYSLKSKLKYFHGPIKKLIDEISDLNKSKTNLMYEIERGIAPKIRECQLNLAKLNDGRNMRMEMLKNVSEHTYKALGWLRENRKMFRCAVHEPMLLELNFADAKFAKYVESTVAFRDLIAFTFEDTNDMNLFLKIVRLELKLSMVNAVCSPPNNSQFLPDFDINKLRHLGFYTFLNDVVSGPDAIINYLCRQYQIYRIPIGDNKTYNNSEKVPNQVRYFYSEKHKFTTQISIHSGEKATSSSEIRPVRLFKSVNEDDQNNIINIQTQLESLSTKKQNMLNNIKQLENKITNHEEELNGYYSQKKTLQESLQKLVTVQIRISKLESEISTLKNSQSFNLEEETKNAKKQITTILTRQYSLQREVLDCFNKLQKNIIIIDLVGFKYTKLYKSIQLKNAELTEFKNNSAQIEKSLADINNRLQEKTVNAKKQYCIAKASTNNQSPNDEKFMYKKEFLSLPKTSALLQEMIETLNTKLNLRDSGDNQAVEKHKQLQKSIKALHADSDSIRKQVDNLNNKMLSLKDKWLSSLEKHISNIGIKFGDMFSQLGCAGEVRLMKSGEDNDYDKYGISIMVKFREDEQLQHLTSHRQSGGEQALATAIYLMALQQLSKAPFRCVDEVNQGMDPINERKMFQLLIKVMSESNTSSQYFLLTPKLLYGLEYTPLTCIHTINNGSHSVKYSKWSLSKFIKCQKD